MNTRLLTVLALSTAVVAAPAAAQAATWGGPSTGGDPNVNYAYPNVTILFEQNNSRVGLRNVQLLLECTDRTDGYVHISAFSAGGPTGYSALLQANRIYKHFVSRSNGLTAQVTVNARMRPDGTGRARVQVAAVGRDTSTGAIIDDCQADVTFRLRKFRAGNTPPWAEGL